MMRPQVQESVTASQYDQYISLQRGKIRLSRSARPSRFSRRLILSSLSLRGLKTLYNYTLGWVLPNYDSSDAEVSLHYGWGGRQPAPRHLTTTSLPHPITAHCAGECGGTLERRATDRRPLRRARTPDIHRWWVERDKEPTQCRGKRTLKLSCVSTCLAARAGCFNGDPHPGNILCVDGKLALIDYGSGWEGVSTCTWRHASIGLTCISCVSGWCRPSQADLGSAAP